MSYKATNWAYELPLRGSTKPVLVVLADMADDENSCFPGQERIARMSGLNVRTVQRALAKLEEFNLIEREHRVGFGGFRTSDRYRLLLENSLDDNLSPDSESPDTVSDLPDTVTEPTRQSVVAEENHQLEPLEEPPVAAPTKNGTRVPDPFIVTAPMRAWAASRTPNVNVDLSTEMFVNYWRSKARDATKRDWPATWRNWLLSDQDRAKASAPARAYNKDAWMQER